MITLNKKVTSIFLTLIIFFTQFVFIYADENNSALNEEITDLIVTQDEYGDVLLKWPAVDKNGKIIQGTLLTATKDPFNGTIISGPVIDGEKIVTGIKLDNGGNAIYDDTIIADSFANAYVIEYSTDGIEFSKMCTITRNDRGGKINNVKYTFLPTPQNYTIKGLEENTKYYFRISAHSYTGDIKKGITITNPDTPYKIYTTASVTTPSKTPAFPTAEGGGKYSRGGRGGDVYVVTNLTDNVADPQPGSLRYGLLRKDLGNGKTSEPRTIVFAVGGIIEIDPTVSKSKRYWDLKDNTTIAGQTAPGEGITLKGGSLKISGKNIILRYIRCRLDEGYDRDAATVSGAENVIVDHCSIGWGIDELFSVKETLNSTVQYSIISEPLAMANKRGPNNNDAELVSGESEAYHGFGGIWDGNQVTYHHNLLADCGSRNPRFQGGFEYYYNRYENKMELINNVIYNWGFQSAYGGDRGNGETNILNNYYKAGPNTYKECIAEIFDPWYDETYGGEGSYYVNGNVVESYDKDAADEVTNDNIKGFRKLDHVKVLNNKVDLLIPTQPETAVSAYNTVLNNSGVTIPARDSHDARVINDVKNNTGRIINSPIEVSGYDFTQYESTIADTDNDGISDDWENSHGLNYDDKSDASQLITEGENKGYSYIELYINEIAGDYENKANISNPKISILNVNENSSFTLEETYTIKANAEAMSGKSIDKIELYLNNELLGEFDNNGELQWTPSKEGTYYLLAKAYDNDGLKTLSKLIGININAKETPVRGLTNEVIGNPAYSGILLHENNSSNIVMYGAGLIGSNYDNFNFAHFPVSGDTEFIVRVDDIKKIGYYEKAGIMIRESLDPDSKMVMAAHTYLKGETYPKDSFGNEPTTARRVQTYSRNEKGEKINKELGNNWGKIGVDVKPWIKVTKISGIVTVYISEDGQEWKELQKFNDIVFSENCYIGLAVDAAQQEHELKYYNRAVFSNVSFDNKELFMYGDVTGDGFLTADDAARVLVEVISDEKHFTPEQLQSALVTTDNNGVLSAREASLILQKVLKQLDKFPVEDLSI